MRWLFLVGGLLMATGVGAACLNVADITTLSGTLVSKIYPGPEDTPEPHTRLVLELEKPLECVTDIDDTFKAWNKDVTTLTSTTAMRKKAMSHLNQHVTITGEAMLADNAYDFTAIVIFMRDIKQYPKGNESNNKVGIKKL
ncbi:MULTISPECIES: hypothetical protein [Enterobacterales]|uniref:hypothetical protein n=1 Tax=Enterobacterales TaxID=91347 RepID=UPI002ED9D092